MTAQRMELLRALGAVADSPQAARAVAPALGLGPVSGAGPVSGPVSGLGPLSDAEHTEAFVLNCPPYAAVYLSPEGALGGEAADRVAGFWRAIGLTPPAEPDHLAALLGLYASLGEAAARARRPATAAALARFRAALLHEHLCSWLPVYLDAVTDLAIPGLVRWAGLLRDALAAEAGAHPPAARLPLALREASPGAGPGPAGNGVNVAPPLPERGLCHTHHTPRGEVGPDDLIKLLTTPVRSGLILTRRALAHGADQAGVGHRIGERRFTLRAMLEQDPAATLDWLATEARRWQARHAARPDPGGRWWAARAGHTARLLAGLAADVPGRPVT